MNRFRMPREPVQNEQMASDDLWVKEGRLNRDDARTIAWVEAGSAGGHPVLRIPGTPASRYFLPWDHAPWLERDIRMITTERPGFGASTAHESRTVADHVADLVALMDHLGIARVPVLGISGGAIYVLALAAMHPGRVAAASIVVGSAPLDDEEAQQLIGLNATFHRLAKSRDTEALARLLDPVRKSLLADPLAAFRETMRVAPSADHAIIDERGWQEMFVRGFTEALKTGVQGWVDESMLLVHGWAEVDVTHVQSSLTWWHGDHDRNVPITAVRRLLARAPNAQLVVWPEAGHLTPYRHERDILDDLLARS